MNASDFLIADCEMLEFDGDGILIYDNSSSGMVARNYVHHCDRNGITLGGSSNWSEHIRVADNVIAEIAVQPIDFEPDSTGGLRHVWIERNTLTARATTGSDPIAMAIGSTTSKRGTNINILNNTIINGQIGGVTENDSVTIEGNTITIASGLTVSPEEAIKAQGYNARLTIRGNHITHLGPTPSGGTTSTAAIWSAANVGGMAGSLIIADNEIVSPNRIPIAVWSGTDVRVQRNYVTTTVIACVWFRSTLTANKRVSICDNVLLGATSYPVLISGISNSGIVIDEALRVERNTSSGSSTFGVYVDDTSLAAGCVVDVNDNVLTGVSTHLRLPSGYRARRRVGGVLVVTGAATPEAAVTAPVGSLYARTDGGAATTLYVKESGTGNTGWVAK